MRKISRTILAAALAGCMALTPLALPQDSMVHAEDSVDEIRQKQEETNSKKREAEQKLQDLKDKKEDLLQTISDLDDQINDYQEKVTDLTSQRNAIQAEVAITENNLQDAYVAESNQYSSMKERIQFAYENGDAEYIDALMSVTDYSSITNESEYVSQVSSYDQQQLNALAEIEKTIHSYQTTLQENLQKVNDLKSQAEDEQGALQVMQDGKQELLGQTEGDIEMTEEDIEKYQQQAAAQEASIDALIAQAEAARAAAEQAAQQQAAQQQAAQQQTVTKTVTKTVTETVPASTPGDAPKTVTKQVTEQVQVPATPQKTTPAAPTYNTYTGGGMSWPIPGYYSVSSGLGMRWGSHHNGIDIPAPIGTPVYACADGYVITAQSGYYNCGNAIVISHGNGITSMYYHLSGFAVGAGQNVKKGQLIGYSGNTGFSTGPHLHWGLKVNGSYVDPRGY